MYFILDIHRLNNLINSSTWFLTCYYWSGLISNDAFELLTHLKGKKLISWKVDNGLHEIRRRGKRREVIDAAAEFLKNNT